MGKNSGQNNGNARTDAHAETSAASTNVDNNIGDNTTSAETKTPVSVRHKTPNQHYRCAGLALTRKAQTHEVTPAQLERLRRDTWVEVKGNADDDTEAKG